MPDKYVFPLLRQTYDTLIGILGTEEKILDYLNSSTAIPIEEIVVVEPKKMVFKSSAVNGTKEAENQ